MSDPVKRMLGWGDSSGGYTGNQWNDWVALGGREANQEELANIDNDAYLRNKFGARYKDAETYIRESKIRQDAAARKRDLDTFQKAIPGYEQNIYDSVQKDERRKLAQDMSQTNRAMNRRGLLFSGVNQDAQERLKAASAGNLAQTRQDIRSTLNSQFEQMRDNAIGTGLGIQQNLQAASDMAYRQALSNMAQRRAMLSSVGSAVGTAAGMYLAGPYGAAAGSQIGGKIGGS